MNRSPPAADVLFRSAGRTYGWRVVGVLLTGGDHGMPASAVHGDSSDRLVPLDRMAGLIARLVGQGDRAA